MERPTIIRAVMFEEEGMWVAQCLEYNLASSGETQEELAKNLQRQLNLLSQLNPDNPFRDFKPAPQRFFKMYEEAAAIRKPESLSPKPRLAQRLRAFIGAGQPMPPQVLAAAYQ